MDQNFAVIFDLDGTLTDSKPGVVNCLRKAIDASNVTWEGSLDWFIGPPIEQSMVQLMPHSDDAARAGLVEIYRACYDATGWAENSVYPGVPELLAALQEREARLFICTSKPENFALRILENFGLDGHFIAVYADRGLEPHTKIELLGTLIKEQGLDPPSTFMVGDRKYDIEAAKVNGLRGIAVTYGYGSAEELAAEHPLALCPAPGDVLAAILSAQ